MGSEKSKYIKDKPKFKKRFDKCPQEIQDIFNTLREKSLSACNSRDWGYSDKPDFRIAHKHTIIEFVPKSDHVLVMLRVDRQPLKGMASALNTISVSDARESGKPGYRWVEFEVSKDEQLDDALTLVKNVYEDRKRAGW